MGATAEPRFACCVDPTGVYAVWDDRIGIPAMHRGRVLSYRDPRHAARVARRLNDIATA